MSIRFVHTKHIAQAVHCIRSSSTKTSSNVKKKLIYTSPNVGLVKLVKKFSLSTLGISAVAAPAIMYFWQTSAAQAADINSSMFIGAAMASACSTGALSFLLSPYVNSIHLHVQNDNDKRTSAITPNSIISIDTLDLFARCRTTTLRLRDLRPVASSSFMTWTVNKQVLERQYALEQSKGIKPTINQHRFWLDQRNGTGDRDAMSSVLRIVHEQGRPRMI